MSLKDTLRADRIAAMKAHDEIAKNALGMALTAVQRAETEGEAHAIDDSAILAIITKEVTSRKDSAEAYAAGGRQDLVDKELSEAAVLQRYLPQPLTEAELDELISTEVANITAQLGEAPTMRQMGQIVKAVNASARGRAPGATVAAKVKAKLA